VLDKDVKTVVYQNR